MATVNDKRIVDEIIQNNGHYHGDPVVVKIVQYNNQFDGGIAYGLLYEFDDPMRYENAAACHNVQVLWERP